MDLTQAFLRGTRDVPEYREALEIVRANASGKIWLIGGFIFRSIAEQLYGVQRTGVDLDFIVENPASEFNLPEGWKITYNRLGNPKFVNGPKEIDFVPLGNIYSIKQRGLEPKIEHYLTGVPLTIQSIAYDIEEGRLIGERGFNALRRRVVEVNHFGFALYGAEKKELSLNEMIREKAESLGFKAIYPL